MADNGLETVLARLDVDPQQRGSAATDEPVVLTVGCSLADCEHDPGWLTEVGATPIAVPTLGNRTWDQREGERELHESIRGAITDRTVAAVVVVGHTDCEVVADAYDRYCGPDRSAAAGVRASLAPLERVVADVVDGDKIDTTGPRQRVHRLLVEANVVRNVAFLRARLSAPTVAGVVVDQAGVYGAFPDRQYLVALNETTEPAALRARLPDDAQLSVGRLLSTTSIR